MEAIAEVHRLTAVNGKNSTLVTAQSHLKRLIAYEAHIKELKFGADPQGTDNLIQPHACRIVGALEGFF